MGLSTRFLIRRVMEKTGRRRALAVLMAADACLLAVGIYLIASWLTYRSAPASPAPQEPRHLPPAVHKPKEPRLGSEAAPRGSEVSSARGRIAARKGMASRTSIRAPRISTGQTAKVPKMPEVPTSSPPGTEAPRARPFAPHVGPGSEPLGAKPPEGLPEPPPDSSEPRPPGTEPRSTPARPGSDSAHARQQQQQFLMKVRTVVRRSTRAIRQCYEQALKLHGRELKGQLYLKFQLNPKGGEARTNAVSNSTGSAALERCVVSLASKLRFSAPPPGVNAFIYPISFRAKR